LNCLFGNFRDFSARSIISSLTEISVFVTIQGMIAVFEFRNKTKKQGQNCHEKGYGTGLGSV
jgi:hypothetical protein